MAKNTQAPEAVPLSALSMAMPKLNSALVIDRPDPDPASKEVTYNGVTDDGLASLRSKHEVLPAADRGPMATSDLPVGQGLSLRIAMAGQGENNQMPFRTDQYGKMRN
jgi:hypothetical protein